MITIPGKIPVRIHPIFLAFAILISAISSGLISTINSATAYEFACWLFVVFVSVIVHEMGHALTAVAFGQKAYIDLTGFGGLTNRYGKTLSLWKEFIIVLNGPLAGFLLCGLSLLMLHFLGVSFGERGHILLQIFFVANVFWTLLNLLPVQPLDGGQLLRIFLEMLLGIRGVKIAFFIGLFSTIAASIYFFSIDSFIGGVIFMMLTYENYTAWKKSLAMSQADQSDEIKTLMKEAKIALNERDESTAIQKLKAIRQSIQEGVIYLSASELLAKIYIDKRMYADAYDILLPLKSKLSPLALRMLQESAFQKRLWKEALLVGIKAYQAAPDYATALTNAMSHAQLQEAEAAIGWMKCAIRDGLPSANLVIRQSDFDPIRRDPLFQRLQAEIATDKAPSA